MVIIPDSQPPKPLTVRYIQRLERTFGTLTKHEKEFVNTGVAHKQTDAGDIYMNQDKCIDDLRPIRSPSMSRHTPDAGLAHGTDPRPSM